MKLIVFFTTIFLLACTPSESLDNRLRQFYKLLEDGVIISFKQGKVDEVVAYIDQKIATDESLKKQYLLIKKNEGIDFFSTQQLVEFYYYHFLSKAKK